MVKYKSIISLIVAAVIAVSCFSLLITVTAIEPSTPSVVETFTNHESQLFKFEIYDYSDKSYCIRNISTEMYLMQTQGGNLEYTKTADDNTVWYIEENGDGYSIKTADNKYLIVKDVNGNAVFSVEEAALLTADERKVFLENGNGDMRKFVLGATFAIRFNVKIAEKNAYLCDNSEPVYSISKYSDSLTSSNSQIWTIRYKKSEGGKKYYTIINSNSGKYLYDNPNAADKSPLEFSSNAEDPGVLWEIIEVEYLQVPEECKLENNYVHYYRLVSKSGRSLKFDALLNDVIADSSAGNTPSSLVVFGEGGSFDDELYTSIMILGGDSTGVDVYNPGNALYLKAIKYGNEYTFGLFWKNNQNNQKWEITYIDTAPAAGNDVTFGTDYHYYTLRSVSLDKYLTIEDGVLTLANYTGAPSQQWCLYDMEIRWQSESWKDKYALYNREYKWALTASDGFGYSVVDTPTGVGGGYGCLWEMCNAQTGADFGLNHGEENFVKNATVMLRGLYTSVYIQVDGPELEDEDILKTVYISNNGNDSNDGKTADKPIATIEKLNSLISEYGIGKNAKILFECGGHFDGTIVVNEVYGKKYKNITFGNYGETAKGNPVIKAPINQGALLLTNSTYIDFNGIDFCSSEKKGGEPVPLIEMSKSVQISLKNSVLSADNNSADGIYITECGNSADLDMSSVVLDNVVFKNLNNGICSYQMDGSTLSSLAFVGLSGCAIRLYNGTNNYLYNLTVEDCASADISAIQLKDFSATVEKVTIKNLRNTNAIEILSSKENTAALMFKNCKLNHIGGNGIYLKNSEKDEGVALDSVMVDNLLFREWGTENSAVAFGIANSQLTGSYSLIISNSTFVKSDNQVRGSDYFNAASAETLNIRENNNTYLSDAEYKKELLDLNRIITVAALLPQGNTSDTVFQNFLTILESARSIYNSYYPTFSDIRTASDNLKLAADSLDNSGPQEIEIKSPEDGKNDSQVLETNDEEITIDVLRKLIENADGDINLRADNPFILTCEMQQLFIDSGKKLTVTFYDDNDVIYLQWIFPYFEAKYDIDLGLNDTDLDETAQELSEKGKVVSLKHRGELPTGTKIIVQNGFFTEKVALSLYYLYEDMGEYRVIDENLGVSKVLISGDLQHLQITVNTGGDFLIKAEETADNDTNSAEKQNSVLLLWITIAVIAVALITVLVLLFVKKRKNKS